MPSLPQFALKTLEMLGLGQARCAHCFRPFFPLSCKENIAPELCSGCNQLFAPFQGEYCQLCGNPGIHEKGPETVSHKTGKFICPSCQKNPPVWDKFSFYGLYSGALRDTILRLKFDGELHLARLLGKILLETTKCLHKPDVLLAIPQYPVQLRKRGYNQAHEIARAMGNMAGMNVDVSILRRIRPGVPQESLNAAERRRNLAGAFLASEKASGKRIWLIDDVMTTGATLNEAAIALKAAGAAEISALCVARTPLL